MWQKRCPGGYRTNRIDFKRTNARTWNHLEQNTEMSPQKACGIPTLRYLWNQLSEGVSFQSACLQDTGCTERVFISFPCSLFLRFCEFLSPSQWQEFTPHQTNPLTMLATRLVWKGLQTWIKEREKRVRLKSETKPNSLGKELGEGWLLLCSLAPDSTRRTFILPGFQQVFPWRHSEYLWNQHNAFYSSFHRLWCGDGDLGEPQGSRAGAGSWGWVPEEWNRVSFGLRP